MCTKRMFGRGECKGDSGGPLIVKGDNGASDLQVGVVSFGSALGCATDLPDVEACVSYTYEWIQTEVCKWSTYASEAGFVCSSIVLSPTDPPAYSTSTSPPVSLPSTNPPAFSLTNAPTSSPPGDAHDDAGYHARSIRRR
jgi:hypothetical protein